MEIKAVALILALIFDRFDFQNQSDQFFDFRTLYDLTYLNKTSTYC